MKIKLSSLMISFILIIIFFLIFYLNRNNQSIAMQNNSTVISHSTNDTRYQIISNIFSTPIAFYGKVIDQNGNAVESAEVYLTAVTNMSGFSDHASKHYRLRSDAQGLFSIEGIEGAVLSVQVQKQGYYIYKHYCPVTVKNFH